MAQTQSGMSFVEAYVFCSPDGTTWTDMAGHGASIAVGGGKRSTGEQNTFDGVTPIVKGGDRASTDITCRFVYTETASEPYDVAQTAHESASGLLYVQYRVKNAGVWFKSFSAANFDSIITDLVKPQGDAGSGDVVMSEFIVKCAELSEAAAST